MKKALIFDLDNTLYNWMDAYAESFKAQADFLCKVLSIEEDLLFKDFKRVFKKYGSVEIPNAVFQLSAWNACGLCESECEQIKEKSLEIFLESWKKNIKLFVDVRETLEWARDSGFIMIAYSDAFAFWINFRLNTLNIADYFDSIYAMTDERISDSCIVSSGTHHSNICTVAPEDIKPNVTVLNRIIKNYNLSKDCVYFIGDSIIKDIEAAQQFGITDIWARYGLNYRRESGRILSKITPWEKGTGGRNELREKTIPTYTIQNLSEIRSIII